MPNLSRRSLIASVGALPALAVPAVALANNPDAELLRLAPQLELIAEVFKAADAVADKMHNEWEAACHCAGLPDLAWEDVSSEKECWERHNARMALQPENHDPDQVDENGTTIWEGSTIGSILWSMKLIVRRTENGLRIHLPVT